MVDNDETEHLVRGVIPGAHVREMELEGRGKFCHIKVVL